MSEQLDPKSQVSATVQEMRSKITSLGLLDVVGRELSRWADALESAERGAARMIGERGELLAKLEAAERRIAELARQEKPVEVGPDA